MKISRQIYYIIYLTNFNTESSRNDLLTFTNEFVYYQQTNWLSLNLDMDLLIN